MMGHVQEDKFDEGALTVSQDFMNLVSNTKLPLLMLASMGPQKL